MVLFYGILYSNWCMGKRIANLSVNKNHEAWPSMDRCGGCETVPLAFELFIKVRGVLYDA